jgi:hypothetical protein
MIIVTTEGGRGVTLSDLPYEYKREEYETVIAQFKTWIRPEQVESIEVQGKHLELVCDRFSGIIKPNTNYGLPGYGFLWFGDDAKTLFANIQQALRFNVSDIVQTVDDHFHVSWYDQHNSK